MNSSLRFQRPARRSANVSAPEGRRQAANLCKQRAARTQHPAEAHVGVRLVERTQHVHAADALR